MAKTSYSSDCCPHIGFKSGDFSWIAGTQVELKSTDGSVAIDASQPGCLDFSATGTSTGVGVTNCIDTFSGVIQNSNLVLTITQENCTTPAVATIDVTSLIGGGVGSVDCLTSLTGQVNGTNLEITIEQDNCTDTFGSIDVSSLVGVNTDTVNEGLTTTFTQGTGELEVRVSQSNGNPDVFDTTLIDIQTYPNTAVGLSVNGTELTVSVTDAAGTEAQTTDLASLVLEAICNLPSETYSSIHTNLVMFAIREDTGECVKVIGPVCTDTCMQPSVTRSELRDGNGVSLNNTGLLIDSTTAHVFFDQEIANFTTGIQVFDEVGDPVAGTVTFVGQVGTEFEYEWTPAADLMKSFSYTVSTNTNITTVDDANCVITGEGNVVTWFTEEVANNQLVNGSLDTTVVPWSANNGTFTLATGGARNTVGYGIADADLSGNNLNVLRTGLSIVAGTSYRLVFWHRGDAINAVLEQTNGVNTTILQTVPASANWQAYEFIATAGATFTGRLRFTNTSGSTSAQFCLDEVKLGE